MGNASSPRPFPLIDEINDNKKIGKIKDNFFLFKHIKNNNYNKHNSVYDRAIPSNKRFHFKIFHNNEDNLNSNVLDGLELIKYWKTNNVNADLRKEIVMHIISEQNSSNSVLDYLNDKDLLDKFKDLIKKIADTTNPIIITGLSE